MAEGFFEKVYNDPDDENNYEITCKLKQYNIGSMPQKQKELYILVEKTSNIIKNLPEFHDVERQEARARRKFYRMKKKEEDEKKKKEKKEEDEKKKKEKKEEDEQKIKGKKEVPDSLGDDTTQPPAPESDASPSARNPQNENDNQSEPRSAASGRMIEQQLQDANVEQEDKPQKENTVAENETEDTNDSPSNQGTATTNENSGNNNEDKINGVNKAKVIYTGILLSNARAGLMGKNAQPELAIAAIHVLREAIVLREGGKIRNRNLIRLGICAFSFAILAGALGYFMRMVSEGMLYANTMFADIISKIGLYPYLIVFAGAVIGAWIGYGAESKKMSFSQLSVVYKDGLKSIPRLALFGVSAALLLLFVKSGIIELNLGQVTNEVLMQSTGYQILFGAIGGLLGNRLTTGLVEKAKDMFKATDEIEINEDECFVDFLKQSETEEADIAPTVSFTNKENVVTGLFSEAVYAHNDKTGTLCEDDFVVIADCGSPTFTVKHEGYKATLTIGYKGLKSGDEAYTAVMLKAESAFDIRGKACPQTPYNFAYTEPEKKKEQKK